MRLSRECRYAILGLALLARKPAGTIIEVAHVAEKADLPAPFLAKTFGKLTHYGVLVSFRGKQRGYALARPADEISIGQIIQAIEGPDVFDRCVFGTVCDEDDPCPMHTSWSSLKSAIAEVMSTTTLRDIAAQIGVRASASSPP